MSSPKLIVKAGPLKGRANLVPEKVAVHRLTGTNMETRLVDPSRKTQQPKQRGGGSGVQQGEWEAGEPMPAPAHIRSWQDGQVQRVEAYAKQNGVPLNSDLVRFTIQKVRSLTSNNDVHNFIDKHTAGRSGIKLEPFKHERQSEPGEKPRNASGWEPPSDHTYLGAKKATNGKYEFIYDRPNQKGKRALKAPPSDHPDYKLYQEQAEKDVAKRNPYMHKYRSFPALATYPPADINPKDVQELGIRDPKRVHLDAALMYRNKEGKVQYCYTQLHQEYHACKKFLELNAFAQTYPKIKSSIQSGLEQRPGSVDHAMATILGLVDKFVFRVGQEEGQEGVGVTLFQKQHVTIRGDELHFDFIGKHGVEWERVLKRKSSPELFDAAKWYYGKAKGKTDYLFKAPKRGGAPERVNNNMVNDWLKGIQTAGLSPRQQKAVGSGISVKDFRTYHATNMMRKKLSGILNMNLPRDRAAARSAVIQEFDTAAEEVASYMGHSKRVLLDNYVDPSVIKYFERRAGGNYGFIKSLRGEDGGEHEDFVDFLGNVEHELYNGDSQRRLKHLHTRVMAGFDPHRDQDQLPAIY